MKAPLSGFLGGGIGWVALNSHDFFTWEARPCAMTAQVYLVKFFCQDMTLRDYAQGAYRMRGIGQGSHLMEFQVRSLNVFGKVSMT